MQRIFYFKYFLIYVLCFRSFDDARQLHSDEVNQLNWKKWSRNSSSFHYLFGHKFMCLNKNSIKKTHSAGEWVNPNVYIFQSLTVSALFEFYYKNAIDWNSTEIHRTHLQVSQKKSERLQSSERSIYNSAFTHAANVQ